MMPPAAAASATSARPATGVLVFARRPLRYGGRDLDRGQVFALARLRNDEVLLRLGYVQDVDGGAQPDQLYRCAECGAEFLDLAARTAHGNRRHRPQPALTPLEEDSRREREERQLDVVAPLRLDQTLATLNA